jgi:integrase
MATTRIGIYRKYRGPVPKDDTGRPLPKSKWRDTRPFSWAARWFGSEGKRYSKSFDTRKEAERFAEAKQAEVRQGNGDPPESCTMRAFLQEHVRLSRGAMRRTTLLLQVAAWTHLAEQVGRRRDVRKVSSKDIETYRSLRAASKTVDSTATLNKELKLLKRLFNLAIQRNYLAAGANPVTIKLAKVGEKRPRYVAPDALEKIAHEANEPELHALIVFLYTEGLRKNEAAHMTWTDIDFVGRVVHVAAHDADGYVQPWEPKDHERREIPIPDRVIEILQKLRRSAPQDCPYVFMGAGRWTYYRKRVDEGEWPGTSDLINNLLRRFKTCCKHAGVGKFTLHDLRRSCITNWAKKGLPIHVVQMLAGHADIETTRKYYLSVQDDDICKARAMQQEIVGQMDLRQPTDPKLTHKAARRSFRGRKEFADGVKVPEIQGIS